ncbi:1,6-dihydroxycyclohexa-2,4-diene-1-carboxylate dehydrogenase [Corynebacterium poyangense]|uniref:1,6-dihydroxycyclohexa-2,4-diene-1-carboxylate dehydrogenase n=2 Tax=Corynebacterium poyangense TaxID=2684405 RepID=A0A7H0SSH2_9CORY|nr:1,6-dihydroxycyclohexa-2,4-diene-1-carboxylate dehydrogenase [Corynebacterium poyangense]MBZ8178271.1 1,6-dihydroxycyclohexa-2,4-diene-1-carboxylate dehydrogenase [Corynebacterium poyangense]QNQ91497.1 1,6-dihydroxycyclohexa-2,4-diene-1-carboxylate dehydrogenase [Corynebacterium poyangense]
MDSIYFHPNRFSHSNVLVTGAAQGIGKTVALRLALEGANLALVDRDASVHEYAAELQQSCTGKIFSVTADLENWEGAQTMVDETLSQLNSIDIAINAVGGTIWAKPFERYSDEEIIREIDRSLFTTLWSVRAELPGMIEQQKGTIINVSSVATAGINRVPYAAAKGGVNALTSALAREAASHGIRVVATAPGGTLAPARDIPRGPVPQSDEERAWYQDIVEQTLDSSLMGRYGTLEEQAAAITFLASKEASYITGSVLPVAGGDQG